MLTWPCHDVEPIGHLIFFSSSPRRPNVAYWAPLRAKQKLRWLSASAFLMYHGNIALSVEVNSTVTETWPLNCGTLWGDWGGGGWKKENSNGGEMAGWRSWVSERSRRERVEKHCVVQQREFLYVLKESKFLKEWSMCILSHIATLFRCLFFIPQSCGAASND